MKLLFFLCLAMVISVWTKLRFFTGVGLSEIIILILARKLLTQKVLSEELTIYHCFKRIFIIFFAIIPIGILWNLITVFSTFTMLHDFLAMVFCAVLTLMVLVKIVTVKNVNDIIKMFLVVNFFICLYYLKMYRSGSGMYLETRFCGYSTDPNQLAECLFLNVWFGMYLFEQGLLIRNNRKFSLLIICSMILSVYLGFLTESDSLELANMVALVIYLFHTVKQRQSKMRGIAILIIIVSLFYLCLNFQHVLDIASSFFEERAADSNQLNGRLVVWKHGIEAFLNSPVFGNGPGAHSGNWFPFGHMESHNTFIYILMDYGLIGFIVLLSLLNRIFKVQLKSTSPAILAAFFAFIVFIFFHSFQRMPLFWFYLVIFCVVGHKGLNPQQKN